MTTGTEQKLAEHIQSAGDSLSKTLADLISAGGNTFDTVQALELFIRAVIRDCLVRGNVLVERDHD